MSTELVKKKLLLCTSAINIPLDRTPRDSKIDDVCFAAKFLRKRLVKEHAAVVEKIQLLRERYLYEDEENEDEPDEIAYQSRGSTLQERTREADITNSDISTKQTCRHEFMFLADLHVAEKIVIPVLLAHGIKFIENLLPHLLKLLIALLMPIPRFSAQEAQQKDLVTRTKIRCGTDQFFALMVQIVARIATKRASGNASESDFSLLTIVLTTLSYVLEGQSRDMTGVVGSFCRSQGVELLLVVVSQNYAKTKPAPIKDTPPENVLATKGEKDDVPYNVEMNDACDMGTITELNDLDIDAGVGGKTESTPQEGVILNEGSTSDDAEDEMYAASGEDFLNKASSALQRQFEERVRSFFESEQQIWRWNVLVMKSLSSVLSCVSPPELAQISIAGSTNLSSLGPNQHSNMPSHDSMQLKACKQENDKWHFIARGRNGAISSNSILVRSDPQRDRLYDKHGGVNLDESKRSIGSRTIGTVSTLFGTKHKDPLQPMKDIDFRKRGRFVGGMSQGSVTFSDIPLPTKIQLSKQIRSFLCFGFDPLNAMTWESLEKVIHSTDQSTKEYKETMAGYRNSGEVAEMTSPLEAGIYESFSNVLVYVKICTSFLSYIRETAHIMKLKNVAFNTSPFQEQWHSVSSIISLGHLDAGFAMLRCFLQCKDLRQRMDMIVVVQYIAQMLLVLSLLLKGDLIQDTAVTIAAHALVSSTLYKEVNIKTVFDAINLSAANRKLSVAHAQALILLVGAVFELIDQCSFKGRLLLMKRSRQKHEVKKGKENDNFGCNDKGIGEHEEKEMSWDMAHVIGQDEKTTQNGFNETSPEPLIDLQRQGAREGKESYQRKDSPEPDTMGFDEDKMADALHMAPSVNPFSVSAEAEGNDDALLKQTISDRISSANDKNDLLVMERDSPYAACEPQRLSVSPSAFSALSDLDSEREVTTRSCFHRLSNPKHMNIMNIALQHWRVNDADINSALIYLVKRLVEEGCESVFYNVNFLLIFRDILVNGKQSHPVLYDVCNELTYNFFNPIHAKMADDRARACLNLDQLPMLSGAESFLGFEVALRCARSLFTFSPTDYKILEEKAMPNLTSDGVFSECVKGLSPYSNADNVGVEGEKSMNLAGFKCVSADNRIPEQKQQDMLTKMNQEYLTMFDEEKIQRHGAKRFNRDDGFLERLTKPSLKQIRTEETLKGITSPRVEVSDDIIGSGNKSSVLPHANTLRNCYCSLSMKPIPSCANKSRTEILVMQLSYDLLLLLF